MRDDNWLLSRLDYLWSNYFGDVPQINPVFIRFGRYSRLRLGSIRLDRATGHTHITITSMFKEESIPQAVIDHTIAHELTHYAHGFSSPHARKHKHPHQGGVIQKEMEAHGLGHLYQAYKAWVKDYRKVLADRPRVRRKRRIVRVRWI